LSHGSVLISNLQTTKLDKRMQKDRKIGVDLVYSVSSNIIKIDRACKIPGQTEDFVVLLK